MSSPKRFQKTREINVCHMYIRLDKKTNYVCPDFRLSQYGQ